MCQAKAAIIDFKSYRLSTPISYVSQQKQTKNPTVSIQKLQKQKRWKKKMQLAEELGTLSKCWAIHN